MKLNLSPQCPIFHQRNRRYLFPLLEAVATGQHQLISPGPSKLRTLIGDEFWRMFGENLTQASKSRANTVAHGLRPLPCQGCDPSSLSRFSTLPLLIIVENSTTDGAFLREVLRTFRPTLHRRSLPGRRNPQLVIRHAGGNGEMPKIIQEEAVGYRFALPANIPAAPLRILALTDSDKRSARHSHEESGPAAVRAAAAQAGARVHVLAKRSIENYIPAEALDEYVSLRRDRQAAATYIQSLSAAQWDFYPMKTGYAEGDFSDASIDTPMNELAALGLGDFIADLITTRQTLLPPAQMRRRDGAGDLEALVTTIEELV